MQLVDMNQQGLYNALLEWGKCHILSPQITSYLKKIEDYFRPYVVDRNLECLLLRSIEELGTQAETAISVLSNTDLVMSTEDDPIWHKAEEAFYAFDRINYFMDAVYFLIAPDRKDIYPNISQKLDGIFSRVTSWLEEGDFSAMRLVVLNDTRRERLSDIPEEERYLFPWYEIYSEYRDDAIEIIVGNFHDYLSKNWNKVSREIPQEQLVEIWYELNRDNQLCSLIKREAVLHRKLLEAVSIPSSLKLLGLISDESLDYNISEHVEEAGVVRVCIELLNNARLQVSTEAEKLYWTFLGGFCSPGLDDKQRLQLLQDAEDMMKKINITEAGGEAAKVLKNLELWFNGKYEDTQLVKLSFDVWSKMMEEKAANMPAMAFDETPEKLLNAIIRLQREVISPDTDPVVAFIESFIDGCKDIWKAWVLSGDQPAYSFGGALAAYSSSEKPVQQQRELTLCNNPVLLSLRSNPKGEYIILSSLESNRVLFRYNDKQDYENLWKYLENSKGDYWSGFFIKNDGKPDDVKPASQILNRILVDRSFVNIKSGYKKAIIGISSKEIRLNEFMGKLHTMISERKRHTLDSFIKDFIKEIIILIISLE